MPDERDVAMARASYYWRDRLAELNLAINLGDCVFWRCDRCKQLIVVSNEKCERGDVLCAECEQSRKENR